MFFAGEKSFSVAAGSVCNFSDLERFSLLKAYFVMERANLPLARFMA